MAFGPFDVAPARISGLGAAFTQFVNELLTLECRAAGLQGHHLQITSLDNRADGGVDAEVNAALEGEWIPNGLSVWQFKRGDLRPSDCRTELRGATRARALLTAGSPYRLVLGRQLTCPEIDLRREALVEEAGLLGIPLYDGQVAVIAADQLAEWSSRFPAFAVGRILEGPGHGIVDFVTWTNSVHHRAKWVEDEARSRQRHQIQADLMDISKRDIRIQGPSGIGKTRLVMEAIRGSGHEPLVAYAADEDDVSPEVLHHVMQRHRSAILVVDECTARRHDKLVERITIDSTLKLITIGDLDDFKVQVPILEVGELPPAQMDEFLRENHPDLSAEARRVVIDRSAGNVRQATLLAEQVFRLSPATITELLETREVGRLLKLVLPEGKQYRLTAVLALFERIGWTGELRYELGSILGFAHTTLEELDELEGQLVARGIMEPQGRYRAIAPQPLALALAAETWRERGRQIVDELLPTLNHNTALSLFRRLGQLGAYEPAGRVLGELIAPDGLFGSLSSIDEHELGEFVDAIAVVAPDEAATLLYALVVNASLEYLREHNRTRRSLVWALEKLAWRSRTFEQAADTLLRLALAETEAYANNATGMWLSLFGVVLPTTAALPAQRIVYLERCARSDDVAVRALTARACAEHLHPWESATVSGEVQGGSLLEPRGGVRTRQEAGEYRRGLIEILRHLTTDPEPGVSGVAVDGLVAAIHPLLGATDVSSALEGALTSLRGSHLDRARQEIYRLSGILRRGGGDEAQRSALDSLGVLLLPTEPRDQLRLLVEESSWNLEDAESRARMESLLSNTIAQGYLEDVLDWLRDQQLPGGWFLGYALGKLSGSDLGVQTTLVVSADLNLPALAGYLSARVDAGEPDAFDVLLDGPNGQRFSQANVLAITVRGPITARARGRAIQLAGTLPVAVCASNMFPLAREVREAEASALLGDWVQRIESQRDYNLVIDWLSMWLHRHEPGDEIRRVLPTLLRRRLIYSEMGQATWDWVRIARIYVEDAPADLFHLMLDLINDHGLMIFGGSEEGDLLKAAATRDPKAVWGALASELDGPHWKVQMNLRKWFLQSVPVDVIVPWVNSSRDNARKVAALADPGTKEPSPIARFLLTDFGDDDEVKSELAGAFISGTWMGPLSSRLAEQIAQLEGWITDGNGPGGVEKWAAEMIRKLRSDRDRALKEEAEDRW